ncbi:NADPH-dependent cytochrome P450 oxidoreductase [Glomus cerebriforme]|uniref:NADPH--cytochrome P450 reductase n=1 Tax=Glomus cerebriforme TaxID=658196 RepID=A0A397STB7_9GLOM|nr:NADPH-dependent cytochrome P450 oxidoreductase [Glomus cerebriforme]
MSVETETLIQQADEAIIDTFDLFFLLTAGVLAVLYLYKDTLFGNNKKVVASQQSISNNQTLKPIVSPPKKNKNFLKRMKETDKNVILFYGSQTGTAEDYASRLAKEGQQRFGLNTMTVDIEDCDMTLLDKFPNDYLAFFLMATYGEGEPTDDAVDFWELINSESPEFSEGMSIEEKPLSSLRYVVFALGNKTYEHFNAVGRMVDNKLTEFGATRIGERGEGDDDGSLEEDFLGWKENMWKAVCEVMQVDQSKVETGGHIATYKITELETYDSNKVYYGEYSEHALMINGTRPTYDAKNPYPSPIVDSRDLFSPSLTDRNCVHMELDITGSGIYYETGDHVAVWPVNAEQNVERLLKILGLWEKRDTVVTVESTDPSASKKYPFPVPTTYATIFRHYLDIHALTSRQFIATLANYAPTEAGKSKLTTLGQDKEAYRIEVSDAYLTLSEVLESISPNGKPLDSIPLDLIIETLPKLQPRYYSISSSSKSTPTKIHITATVLTFNPTSAPHKTVYGLATNYLLQVHRKMRNIHHPEILPNYLYSGPRNKLYDEKNNTIKLPIHVRRNNFKLPKNLKTPVIMIGPGTGVAPFRGFVIERTLYKTQGEEVGDTILFFGCRRRDEDFLYESEFTKLFETLGESGKLITAFSREMANKVYVQHKLMENDSHIWNLIYNHGGYFYVCGDAKNMARDVNNALIQIAQSLGGMDENSATNYVKDLRSKGRYQEDVWS